MIYRLKELQGDTIAVPQLVFSKLGIAEEYNVRVALYVLATGITDPDEKDTASTEQLTMASSTAARTARLKASFFRFFSILSPAESTK